jgi:hypothetical protein
MDQDEIEKLAWSARAEILWGTPQSEVIDSLLANGMPDEVAQQIVGIALAERRRAVRRKGWRGLVLGLLLLGVAYWAYGTLSWGRHRSLFVIIIASCTGAWTLLGGVERLAKGERFEGSISAVDDVGFMEGVQIIGVEVQLPE